MQCGKKSDGTEHAREETRRRFKICFLALGTRGDVQPVEALAREFSRRNTMIEVIFATHTALVPSTDSSSDEEINQKFRYHPVPTPCLRRDPVPSDREGAGGVEEKGMDSTGGGREQREIVELESMLIAAKDCSLVVFSLFTLIGFHVADYYGIPSIAVHGYILPTAAATPRFRKSLKREYPRLYQMLVEAKPGITVCWREVEEWMWPLFLQDFEEIRLKLLLLPPLPFLDRRTHRAPDVLPPPTPMLFGVSPSVCPIPGYYSPTMTHTGFWLPKDGLGSEGESKSSKGGRLGSKRVGLDLDLRNFLRAEKPTVYVGFGSLGAKGLLTPLSTLRLACALIIALRHLNLRALVDARSFQILQPKNLQKRSPGPLKKTINFREIREKTPDTSEKCRGAENPLSWLFEPPLAPPHPSKSFNLPPGISPDQLDGSDEEEEEGWRLPAMSTAWLPEDGERKEKGHFRDWPFGCACQEGRIFLIKSNTPHSLLFPKLAAAIHHGGSQTTATALRAGLPQAVLWFRAAKDQAYWAEKIVHIGVGVEGQALGDPITAKTLVRILKGLIKPDLKTNALRISNQISHENGCAQAAKIIEKQLNLSLHKRRRFQTVYKDKESSTGELLKEEGRLFVPPFPPAAKVRVEGGRGMELKVHSPEEAEFIYTEIFTKEVYAFCPPLQLNRPGTVVIDIGSHIGLFALWISRKMTPKPHLTLPEPHRGTQPVSSSPLLICIEPVRENFSLLSENLRSNRISPSILQVDKRGVISRGKKKEGGGVEVILGRGGVSEASRKMKLRVYPNMSGNSTVDPAGKERELEERGNLSYRSRRMYLACSREEVVDTISLDQLIQQLGLERVDLVKIDAEGSEETIINAISKSTWAKINAIVLETHDTGNRVKTIKRKLEEAKFRSVRVSRDRRVPSNVYLHARR